MCIVELWDDSIGLPLLAGNRRIKPQNSKCHVCDPTVFQEGEKFYAAQITQTLNQPARGYCWALSRHKSIVTYGAWLSAMSQGLVDNGNLLMATWGGERHPLDFHYREKKHEKYRVVVTMTKISWWVKRKGPQIATILLPYIALR